VQTPGDKAVQLREERCRCGNLLAKVTPEGIEILCRRCKRIHRISWQEQGKEGGPSGNNAVLLTT